MLSLQAISHHPDHRAKKDDRFSPRSAHSDEAFAQTLYDPTFEPQAGFNFADSHSEEQRGLHQTMGSPLGSPQVPNQHSFFDPVSTTR